MPKRNGHIYSTLMGGKSMYDEEKNLKPEVIVFAGPNGSGKSTITKMAKQLVCILMQMISIDLVCVVILKQLKRQRNSESKR